MLDLKTGRISMSFSVSQVSSGMFFSVSVSSDTIKEKRNVRILNNFIYCSFFFENVKIF